MKKTVPKDIQILELEKMIHATFQQTEEWYLQIKTVLRLEKIHTLHWMPERLSCEKFGTTDFAPKNIQQLASKF